MKSRLLGTVLVLAMIALSGWIMACGESLLPDGVVAQVGETYILQEDLDAAVEQEAAAYGITKEAYPDEYDDYLESLQEYVLQNLVVNEVADQQAAEMNLSVTEEEVQESYNEYLAYYSSGDEDAFEEDLATQGMTIESFKDSIREGQLRNKLREEVVKDITSVPEEDIASYYEENKSDYYVEPSRELRHILIKPVASDEEAGITEADWATALATAREVRTKLVATGDWAGLAAEYSDDLTTKDSGGSLGTVHTGEQIKEFEDAAFALDLDDISEPVKTVYGYEIIQATGITAGGEMSLDEVRDEIEAQLLYEAQDEAWNAWLDQKVAETEVIYRDDLRPETTTTQSTTTTEMTTTT